MKEIQHVYQLSIRRPDEIRKQFTIERDTIYIPKKLTDEDIKKIAYDHNCDVLLVYLGTLTPPKKQEIFEQNYYDQEEIERYIIKWKSPIDKIKEEGEKEEDDIQ